MKQKIKLCNLYVVKSDADEINEPEQHSYVLSISFPDSGALLITYKDESVACYAPGQWLSFHTEVIC